MIDFPIVKIGELINAGEAEIQTGPFGTQLKASDYSDHGYPMINVRNVGFGDLRKENLEFINDRIAEKLPTHRLMQKDIVFGRKGAVERHGFITEAEEGWYQGSDCLRLRFNSPREALNKSQNQR
jgi:type I restriction enzyme S subunit